MIGLSGPMGSALSMFQHHVQFCRSVIIMMNIALVYSKIIYILVMYIKIFEKAANILFTNVLGELMIS